jgi:hypothetical protein
MVAPQNVQRCKKHTLRRQWRTERKNASLFFRLCLRETDHGAAFLPLPPLSQEINPLEAAQHAPFLCLSPAFSKTAVSRQALSSVNQECHEAILAIGKLEAAKNFDGWRFS